MYEALKLFHTVGAKILWLFEHTGVKHLDDIALDLLKDLDGHLNSRLRRSHETKDVR